MPPRFKPPKEVPTTFRAPSMSLLLRTPDCVLTNPDEVAGGTGPPRLTCDGDAGGGLKMHTRYHPASFTRKHVTRVEYIGRECKLSACFTAGVFPGTA